MDVHSPPHLNHRFSVDVDSPRSDCSRRDLGFESISSIKSVRSSLLSRLLDRIFGKLPKQHIEFRRAVEHDHFFFDWHKANLIRTTDLRTVTIYQLDQQNHKPLHSWRLENCWLHAWQGPEFNATSPGVTLETFTLCYRSLSWLSHSD